MIRLGEKQMKRWKLIPIIIVVFSLSGCITEYKANDVQTDAVAEYMAGLLLKGNVDYKQALTPLTDITNPEPIEGEDTKQQTEDAIEPDSTGKTMSEKDKDDMDYTLTEVIGESDFEIQYKGYDIVDTYPEKPESTYFTLTPRKGHRLLVATFSVKNVSGKKKVLNLSKAEMIYQLDINVGTVYKPQLSLLENDLQYIDVAIPAGDTISSVLIFEISDKTDVSNISLIITKDKKSEIIEIK